jgi:pimeloyl-ACP methyl ester carboxylesterase
MVERVPYDEFSYFHENAQEFGLPFDGPPTVRREVVDVEGARTISSLVWGASPPELVLLHGGAQNAHTWDTVALALGRPLLAPDLPGHGHSGDSKGGLMDLADGADDIADTIQALVPEPRPLVGMSLGGLTAIALADRHPDLVPSLVLVDVTPGVNSDKAAAIAAFVNGPPNFESFDELLARTIEFNPTRTESSLRRGILHNAEQLDDGSWRWRHTRRGAVLGMGDERGDADEGGALVERDPVERAVPDRSHLWDVIEGLDAPLMLVRGMREQSVVDDDDEGELRRRRPDARIEHVDAGHSVQGDQPVELARLIADFIDG